MAARVAEIPGKGRGWVAARPVRGGEVVLRESPVLVYDASSESEFLIGAYRMAAAQLAAVLSLSGSPDGETEGKARELHAGVSGVEERAEEMHLRLGLGLESGGCGLSSLLLAKDKINAFGLMDSERSVRAYGIYLEASLFNHDCLPNACRFDYGNEIVIRAIHDIPAGSEICLSYFPVNLEFKARQSRLSSDYGFTCSCDRCKVEQHWAVDDDEDAAVEDDEDAAVEDDEDAAVDAESASDSASMKSSSLESEASSFPHAYFFGRYMCQRPKCGGTLAPVSDAPSPAPLLTMECNVCAHLSSLPN